METNFNASRESSTAYWELYGSETYLIEKGSSQTITYCYIFTYCYTFLELYWLKVESNRKRHLVTGLSHISWVISHSGTNFIVKG